MFPSRTSSPQPPFQICHSKNPSLPSFFHPTLNSHSLLVSMTLSAKTKPQFPQTKSPLESSSTMSGAHPPGPHSGQSNLTPKRARKGSTFSLVPMLSTLSLNFLKKDRGGNLTCKS